MQRKRGTPTTSATPATTHPAAADRHGRNRRDWGGCSDDMVACGSGRRGVRGSVCSAVTYFKCREKGHLVRKTVAIDSTGL
jgi:hypothetical protein